MTTTEWSPVRLADGGSERRLRTPIAHRKLILSAIAATVLLGGLTWLVAFSSVLGVRAVAVRGEHTLSAAKVRTAAAVTRGAPLIRLDTDQIRRRVEALPDVASATVTTSYPSTVIVTVHERVAIGVVQAGDGYLLVDRTGAQFRQVARRPDQLPLFDVPHGTGARATGSAVADVAAALPAALRARISSIQASNSTAITLALTNGRTVQWGSAERSAVKAQVFSALLTRTWSELDVSDPDQPFTR